MSRSVPAPSFFARSSRLIPSVLAAVVFGTALSAAAPALAEKPAGARTEFSLVPKGVLSPTAADAVGSGSWSVLLAATNFEPARASWGCGGEWPALAFVVASENPSALGSAERPKVTPGASSWDVFTWSDAGSTTPPDFPGAVLYTKQEVEDSLATGEDLGVPLPKRWSAGQRISMVAYCTSGVDPNGFAVPAADPDGYAITSWLTFTTSASTTHPALTSDGFRVEAAKANSSIALSDSWSGETGTLTATVTSGDSTVTAVPTGTVEFYTGTGAGRTVVGTSTVGATGTATLALSGLAAGTQTTYRADYLPAPTETHFKGSTSAPYTVFAPAAATTTALAVTGARTAGSFQTLTATIAPTTAVGSVTFKDGSTTLGTATVATGKATLTKALAVGEHSVTASFVPADDTLFASSSSPAQRVSIAAKAVPTVSLTVAKGTYGKATTAIVRVSAGATGTVAVTLDGKSLASPRLVGGAATVTIPAGTGAGTHIVGASYAGSATLAAGTTRQSVTIAKAITHTTVRIAPQRVTKALAKKGKVTAVITVTLPGASAQAAGSVVVKVGTAKKVGTLKGGKVTVRLPKSSAKKIKVTVTFGGTANLSSSRASTTVKVSR